MEERGEEESQNARREGGKGDMYDQAGRGYYKKLSKE